MDNIPAPAVRAGHPYHRIALACGILPGADGSLCAICGPSPFPVAGTTRDTFGAGWSDWGIMHNRAGPDLCTGCERLIKGRPGDDPPPLRSRSFAIIDGVYIQLDRTAFYAALCNPPDGLEIISWAMGGKRHHHLHAGWSTPTRLEVGSDDGTIVVDVLAVQPLIAAIQDMRSGPNAKAACTRSEILTGSYRPAAIAAMGAQRWARAESVVSQWRGGSVLSLYVEHTPVLDYSPPAEGNPMIDQLDQRIAGTLATLAQASRYRDRDAIAFWSHFFRRRVQRHAHRDLETFLSRLMSDCDVSPIGDVAETVWRQLDELDVDAQREFMARVNARADVLVALAYEMRKQRATAKSTRSKPRGPNAWISDESTDVVDPETGEVLL